MVIATTLSSTGMGMVGGTDSASSAQRLSASATPGTLAGIKEIALYSEMARSAWERRRDSSKTPRHKPHAQNSEPRAMAVMVSGWIAS